MTSHSSAKNAEEVSLLIGANLGTWITFYISVYSVKKKLLIYDLALYGVLDVFWTLGLMFNVVWDESLFRLS